ncbi:GntR family transcriptional regulator [Nocardioides gansuensis]|uniref:GntR family transcriptional regulator n=1 Tax=Nocardioides gansuensis TaxID=2138300 RepID=A0A2T8F9F2_9ACTN|nr:PLP-dependent aminotransferase family protein [Nocardioides gansuensis]PVG82342.1 GntR family transcriptional regulator [Nocardioides gansuensis]
MPKSQTNPAWDVLLDLRAVGTGPLHERLKRALRAAIRSGRLATGATLPPSRALALDLGCSRWAVTEAYAQLTAEGYLEARPGSGTRVRWVDTAHAADAGVSRASRPSVRIDLAPGLPDLRAFPRARWAAALRTVTANAPMTDLGYADPFGHHELRTVLIEYLQRSRAATASGAQLMVTTGTSSGVRRLCQALASAGHRSMAVEDPGWPRLADAVREAGLEPVPVGVDDQGLRVADLAAHPGTRAVLTAPAHQFPRGVVLTAERRAALLDWAHRVDGLVLEDDYDAEFRYDRSPVSTMQGMDPRRVVLLGSLSKTLSPALGIGWMLVPSRWADTLRRSETTPALPPVLDQLAFARLLTSGGYDRHLRKARRAFRIRRDLLVAELEQRLPACAVSGVAAGLHLVVHLPEAVHASAMVREAEKRGLRVVDLDRYRASGSGPSALVLGYGNITDALVPEAVSILADILASQRA